jgi:hypothetical protein
MERTGAKRGASALQWIAVGVTGLMLALVVWGNVPWLRLWLNDLTTPPLTAHYPYNDFAAEATAVRLLDTPQRAHLFDAATQLAWQEQVWGARLPVMLREPFVRVPWSALYLWPFAELPYAVGFLLLCAVSVAATAAAFGIWARWARLPPVAAAAFVCAGLGSLPLLRTLVLGQHSAVMLLALTASVLWSLQGRDARAGVALAAATLKPHLIILVPLAWLLQRRWRALAAGAASLLALTALSAVVLGPQALVDFVTIQSAFDQYFPGAEAVEQMQNWRGLLESTLGWQGGGEQMVEGVLLLLTATVVVWAWWPGGARPRRAVDLRWALTILASLLFAYHLHLNDLLAWAIPAGIGLRRVYAPPEGAALSPRARQVTLALVWGAWVVPWLAFFAEGARPGLWFMLIAGAALAAQIAREQRAAPAAPESAPRAAVASLV